MRVKYLQRKTEEMMALNGENVGESTHCDVLKTGQVERGGLNCVVEEGKVPLWRKNWLQRRGRKKEMKGRLKPVM